VVLIRWSDGESISTGLVLSDIRHVKTSILDESFHRWFHHPVHMEGPSKLCFTTDSHLIFEDDSQVPITIQEIIYEDGYGQVSVLKADILADAHGFQNSRGEKVLDLILTRHYGPSLS